MPKLIGQEVLCCNRRKCPTYKEFDDGSVELTDDDAEIGSVGTIKLAPDQADLLLKKLLARKK